MVRNTGNAAISWTIGGVALSMLVTVIYDWMPDSVRIVVASILAIVAVVSFVDATYKTWFAPSRSVPVPIVTPPTPIAYSAPANRGLQLDDNLVRILQMFVQFKNEHTTEDVAKVTGSSWQRAIHDVDELRSLNLIAPIDKVRNGRQVYHITSDGRSELVRRDLLR